MTRLLMEPENIVHEIDENGRPFRSWDLNDGRDIPFWASGVFAVIIGLGLGLCALALWAAVKTLVWLAGVTR